MPLSKADGSELRVLFLGAGQMGSAMLRGLVTTETLAARQLAACDVVQERLDALEAECPGVHTYLHHRDPGSDTRDYEDCAPLALEPLIRSYAALSLGTRAAILSTVSSRC